MHVKAKHQLSRANSNMSCIVAIFLDKTRSLNKEMYSISVQLVVHCRQHVPPIISSFNIVPKTNSRNGILWLRAAASNTLQHFCRNGCLPSEASLALVTQRHNSAVRDGRSPIYFPSRDCRFVVLKIHIIFQWYTGSPSHHILVL